MSNSMTIHLCGRRKTTSNFVINWKFANFSSFVVLLFQVKIVSCNFKSSYIKQRNLKTKTFFASLSGLCRQHKSANYCHWKKCYYFSVAYKSGNSLSSRINSHQVIIPFLPFWLFNFLIYRLSQNFTISYLEFCL